MIETNRRRILAGTCAAVLAVLLLMNAVAAATDDGSAPSRGMIAAAGFLAVLQVGLTAGAVFGITQLVRRRADILGLVGAAFTILGATVSARIMVLIQLSMLGDDAPGGVRAAISSVLRNEPAVFASIIPIGLTYPIGMLMLAIALFVARPVPRWVAVAFAIGALLFPMGRAVNIAPAIYLSDAALAIVYGWLSREILTRKELWDDSLVISPAQRAGRYEPLVEVAR